LFALLPVLATGLQSFEEDEKNLLYVAMTRAKKYLAVNGSLLNLLFTAHHNFERIRFSGNVADDDRSAACAACGGSRVDDHNLFVIERPSELKWYLHCPTDFELQDARQYAIDIR
jgi:hypothetical protein